MRRSPNPYLVDAVYFVHSPYGCFGMLGARNRFGLTEYQIHVCVKAWRFLCGTAPRTLDVSEAAGHGSRTRFDERRQTVILGADALSGPGQSANARMSYTACLAHELAHAIRYERKIIRPIEPPDCYLDEAEASVHAACESPLGWRDRYDLVEDARDRLIDWIQAQET